MVAPIWSRYHAYSTETFTSEVLDGYANNETPLGTVVMDMDWHIVRTVVTLWVWRTQSTDASVLLLSGFFVIRNRRNRVHPGVSWISICL